MALINLAVFPAVSPTHLLRCTVRSTSLIMYPIVEPNASAHMDLPIPGAPYKSVKCGSVLDNDATSRLRCLISVRSPSWYCLSLSVCTEVIGVHVFVLASKIPVAISELICATSFSRSTISLCVSIILSTLNPISPTRFPHSDTFL